MSLAKLAVPCAVVALGLSACGTLTKPQAGAPGSTGKTFGARGVVDDLRTSHLKCLDSLHLPVVEQGKSNLLIGTPPNQVVATFTPTPGAAQAEQIDGHAQAAEAIGSALVYPGSAPDSELGPIENCLSHGVKG